MSKAALAAWVNPASKKPVRNRSWTEEEIAYRGGWERIGGVLRPLYPEQRTPKTNNNQENSNAA